MIKKRNEQLRIALHELRDSLGDVAPDQLYLVHMADESGAIVNLNQLGQLVKDLRRQLGPLDMSRTS